MGSANDLAKWSWSNQAGPYQWYIHGSGAVSKYVELSAEFKNPNDTASKQGAKLTLDSTSFWNGQTMRRTELIPQTKAAIASGKVFYHFSMMRQDKNAPSVNREHQICFFESHFTEMKYGWISGESGTSNPNLQWMVNQKSQWKTEWKPGVWHNIAYEIVREPPNPSSIPTQSPKKKGRGGAFSFAAPSRTELPSFDKIIMTDSDG